MREEEKLLSGILFSPGMPELRAIKRIAHNLNNDYNATYEDETEKRAEILEQLLGEMGEGTFMQGPIYFHYGKHTKIGKRVFINFNFTVQDDALVTIGGLSYATLLTLFVVPALYDLTNRRPIKRREIEAADRLDDEMEGAEQP